MDYHEVNCTGRLWIQRETTLPIWHSSFEGRALLVTAGPSAGMFFIGAENDWNRIADFSEVQAVAAAIPAAVPAGMISPFAGETIPDGFKRCSGDAISRITYANLFTVIGTMYGSGDGSTTFNIPDYRGYFLRGFDMGAGNDPDAAERTNRGDGSVGDNVGTKQVDEFKSHTHTYQNLGAAAGMAAGPNLDQNTWVPTSPTGGNETRPKNISVNYIIKT